jgi:hypothetical protein
VKTGGNNGEISSEQRRTGPEIIDLGSRSEENSEAWETVGRSGDNPMQGGNREQPTPSRTIKHGKPAAERSNGSPSSRSVKRARKSQDEQPEPSKAVADADAADGDAAAEEGEDEPPPPPKKTNKAKKEPEPFQRTYQLRDKSKKKEPEKKEPKKKKPERKKNK